MSIPALRSWATRPLVAGALCLGMLHSGAAQPAEPPLSLHDTGLYRPGSGSEIAPANLAFAPQYPLWSDGTSKRRWLYLPPGSFIDASNPDAWEFPIGTRVWKEFALGRPIETRFIERRADGSWRYASYVWNADGSQATLAPAAGIRALAVAAAPGGRYELPARSDCLACHEGAAAPLLGVSALQLSPDRDPLAAHAAPAADAGADLRALVERGWLRNLPPALLERAPRIAAASPDERAALGYLHGNCGHCHNDHGAPGPVKLRLAHSAVDAAASTAQVLRSAVGVGSRYRPRGAPEASALIAPGQAQASVLVLRMRSRDPLVQMPPLGSHQPDAQGLALIERWINHHPSNPQEPSP